VKSQPCHCVCGSQLLSNPATYNNFVTVSGQCMTVAIIISNKMDFNFCAYMKGFHKSSHIYVCTYTI